MDFSMTNPEWYAYISSEKMQNGFVADWHISQAH